MIFMKPNTTSACVSRVLTLGMKNYNKRRQRKENTRSRETANAKQL
jgi:hypothetical protein